ncbi:MAG: aspartate kinase [Eubacteriales bacterium]|nr:aspartate kinase [Eubacteriales bacterium]MDD4541635.1 aspartate kinase [Eubacteriales bacterium]
MIVCKFGGSSLASGAQIRKACSIILDNAERRIVVVSAPGIRTNVPGDKKMTDLLIDLTNVRWAGLEGNMELLAISDRLFSLVSELDLHPSIADQLLAEIARRSEDTTVHHKIYRDGIVSLGEAISGRVVTEYLHSIGVKAKLVDPRDAGLVLSFYSGLTQILPESYDNLSTLASEEELVIFPGFYGLTEEGNTITFSRGGSDISGAVVAAATEADLYENWTDQDHVYAANPNYINDPEPIKEISYSEMRELAYIGFSIIHPEALEPLFSHRIPIRIANTDNPSAKGTMVLAERTHLDNVVTGIAANDDFCTINIRRVLLNQERGILLRILTIFNELDINVEHVPSGIDSLSVIVRGTEFTLEDELVLRDRLQLELGMNDIEVTRNLAVIMIVGEGMRDTVGVIARAAAAIARENISIEVIMSDYHEISCIFMMSKYEMNRAMHGLYNEFFPRS